MKQKLFSKLTLALVFWVEVIVLVTLALASCVPIDDGSTTVDSGGTLLRRVIDRQAGVACWYIDSTDAGIDCLPLSDTLLSERSD